ncbi:hypothetical protein PIB30_002614 [Stylosanthes scabra]|uniref:Uncharacterized protein n=1 Tax=Stylosanthes scabra TaxID=79078 RepID=A0ABU6Z3Y0_9FABA|nr:hypothetical protein [Stylosanthes scabra]
MARNCVSSHAIAMLMIMGMIICFSFIECNHIIPKQHWITSNSYYHIVSELEKCIQRCRKNIPEGTIARRYCISRCHDHHYEVKINSIAYVNNPRMHG